MTERIETPDKDISLLREALEDLLEAYSMGPIDCAAKYGPDVDLREMERAATRKARATLSATAPKP